MTKARKHAEEIFRVILSEDPERGGITGPVDFYTREFAEAYVKERLNQKYFPSKFAKIIRYKLAGVGRWRTRDE